MTVKEQLTPEELTAIVTKDGRTIATLAEDESNVKLFLREYEVKDGSALVPNYVIYYAYCKKWRPAGNKLSKIGFLRKLSIVFESRRTKDTRYYLLNQEVFNLSEEAIDEAKEFDKRMRNKISKKREQKIESKISSSTT